LVFFRALGVILAVILAIVLLRFATDVQLFPFDLFHEVLIEVFAALSCILVFYVLYVYLIGPNLPVRDIAVIRPIDIQPRLKDLPNLAKQYVLWGRSGSYFRAEPLRRIDADSRREKRTTDIQVLLPNPKDQKLVESYNEILGSLGEDKAQNSLVTNVLATCIACAIVNSNNKYVCIKVYLSNFLPAFRLDLADSGAIVTQDDQLKSALFFSAGSEFYEMFHTTVRNEIFVSEEVSIDSEMFKGCSLDEPRCNDEMIKHFDFPLEITDTVLEEVNNKVARRRHRYQ
jgi:hypothetical protein